MRKGHGFKAMSLMKLIDGGTNDENVVLFFPQFGRIVAPAVSLVLPIPSSSQVWRFLLDSLP